MTDEMRYDWGSSKPNIGDIVIAVARYHGTPELYEGNKYIIERLDGNMVFPRPIEDAGKRMSIYGWELSQFRPSEDECGNCASRCRRKEGKCSLYSEV